MDKQEIHWARLCDLQPSQLFISQEKLSIVQTRFDFSNLMRIDPIPYKVLDGLKVMTDGHTRAYAAHVSGLEAVPVFADPDELDWEAYQICVAWCRAEGLYSIADLAGRVVSPEEYERLWYQRCREMQAGLAKKRGAAD